MTEREAAAGEAWRVTLETRARLIAENIELLVGEAQAALRETLRATPAGAAQGFLWVWRASNALVRDVFWMADDGRAVGKVEVSEGVATWLREERP